MKERTIRLIRWVTGAWALIVFIGAGFRVLADCSSFGLPFTDLGSETTFCAAIAEAYYTGLTNGTSATTFSPSASVSRAQMAAFVTRTLDAALNRGSRRAALGQWWTTTPHYDAYGSPGLTAVGPSPELLKSDGADIWVANYGSGGYACIAASERIQSLDPISLGGTVSRVRASDGKKLEDWTGADHAYGVLVAMDRVFVTGYTTPGSLYMIDPSGSAGAVTTVASGLGDGPLGIAFDGNRIWTTNYLGSSVSIITPGASVPWSVTTKSLPSAAPVGIVFDGAHIWVTTYGGAGTILKLDSDGNILQTVTIGSYPGFPAFDGNNIWVPNSGNGSLTVLRASDGAILKTFSGANGNQNGLVNPWQAAFDGQRILVTNPCGGLSLFRAADLSVMGSFPTPGADMPFGVCSDGLNFWVSFENSANIGRF